MYTKPTEDQYQTWLGAKSFDEVLRRTDGVEGFFSARETLKTIKEQGKFSASGWVKYRQGEPVEADWTAVYRDIDGLGVPGRVYVYRYLLEQLILSMERKAPSSLVTEALFLLNAELKRFLGADALTNVLADFLPRISSPHALALVNHQLFMLNVGDHRLEAQVYAAKQLSHARRSGDKGLIGDALYNLVQYHLDGDLDEAAYQLDDAIEYLEDDEWVDLLGSLAVGYEDEGRKAEARRYLEAIYDWTVRLEEQGTRGDYSITNHVYYILRYAVMTLSLREYDRAEEVLVWLREFLLNQKDRYMAASENYPDNDIDWDYQYYVSYLETLMNLYRVQVHEGDHRGAEDSIQELLAVSISCDYDMEEVIYDFLVEFELME